MVKGPHLKKETRLYIAKCSEIVVIVVGEV